MKPAQAKNRPILEWAIDDRPREKLRAKGVKILSDTELLAILIQQGTRNRTAVDLARDVLAASKQNLKELGRLSMADLLKIHGIGEAKAMIILAALELGRRRQAAQNLEKPVVNGASSVASFLQTILQDHDHEVFIVLYLNRANKINHYEIISSGGMSGTVADPRVILRRALEEKAVGIILCHNHPSGSLRPSHADRELTLKIREAARYFDILVLDHIIVSHEGFFSFAEEGLL
ncbi:MAG: DNA repair protein RadC [Sphingobacteriales bacterium]|nr:MAG: DNA repair protein RadC [Sphingobacteriales bacterium]